MRRLFIALLALTAVGCASSPSIRDGVHGTSVSEASVERVRAWWNPLSSTAFRLSASWDERKAEAISVVASVDGYANIQGNDGLRFVCDTFRLSVSSQEPMRHALDGSSSSRTFAIRRDDFARLMACDGFYASVVTDTGLLEGYAKKGSSVASGMRALARRIAQMESWR